MESTRRRPSPGMEKNVLCDNRTGEKTSDLQTDDRYDLDQGVAECVGEHYPEFLLTFGSGGTHIVLTQGLQHGGTGVTGQNSHDSGSHYQGRKNVTLPGVKTCGGQKAKTDGEKLDAHQTQPETGSGKAGDGEKHSEVVEKFSTEDRTEHADEDSEERRPDHARDDEPQGVMAYGMQSFPVTGRLDFRAAAHISVEKIFHIVRILDEDRLIQAEFFTDRFHLFHAASTPARVFAGSPGIR